MWSQSRTVKERGGDVVRLWVAGWRRTTPGFVRRKIGRARASRAARLESAGGVVSATDPNGTSQLCSGWGCEPKEKKSLFRAYPRMP